MKDEKLTVKHLRDIIADLPDDALIDMFNPGAEWYGVDYISVGSVKVIDGRLVVNFGGLWSQNDRYPELESLTDQYHKQARAMKVEKG